MPYTLWLKRLILALVLLLFITGAALLAAFAVLRDNPEQLEGILEAVVSHVLDRELEIGTLVDARLGAQTYLLAKDVRLANPDWADEPDFVRVGTLSLRLNMPSIWRAGPIQITELHLTQVAVSLLAPASQSPNWDFWPDDEPVEKDETDSPEDPVVPILFDDAQIKDGIITYRDDDRDIEVSLLDLVIGEQHDDAMIELSIEGQVNGLPLSVAGEVGPASAILSQRDLQLDLSATLGELTLKASGAIAELSTLTGLDLKLNAFAPQAAPLLAVAGIAVTHDGPLTLEATIAEADKGIALEAKAELEQFQLGLSGTVKNAMELDGVDAQFALDGPSLTQFGLLFGLSGLHDSPFALSGQVLRAGRRLSLLDGRATAGNGVLTLAGVLPDFPEIDDWQVSLSGRHFNLALLGPVIGIEDIPAVLYDIDGSLASTETGVEVVELQLKSAEGMLAVSGEVGEGPEYFNTRLKLGLNGANLALAGLWLELENLPQQPFTLGGEIGFDKSGWSLSSGAFASAGVEIGATGRIDRLPEPTQLEAGLTVGSDDLAAALTRFGYGIDGLPAYPVALQAKLGGPINRLELSGLSIDSGATRLHLQGMVSDLLSAEPAIALTARLDSPDVLVLSPLQLGQSPLEPLPVSTYGKLVFEGGRLQLEQFEGEAGGARFEASGHVDASQSPLDAALKLQTGGPNFALVAAPWLGGDLPRKPFTVDLEATLSAQALVVKRMSATVGDVRFNAKVQIDDIENLTGARGDLVLSGPDSTELLALVAVESDVPASNFEFKASLSNSATGELRVDPLSLDWGKSDYAGWLSYQPGEVPALAVKLHSKTVYLGFLLPDKPPANGSGGPVASTVKNETASVKTVPGQQQISSEPLDFDWLKGWKADIDYIVDRMHVSESATGSAEFSISIAEGVLRSRKLRWDGTITEGDAVISLRALEQGAAVDAYFDMRRLPIMLLLGGEQKYDPDSIYRLKLVTSGVSLKEMASRANGAVSFKGGGGRLDNQGLDFLLGDTLDEIFTRLNPFSETETYTDIECHAGAALFIDGKVKVDPGLIVRTTKMDIAAGGSLNLANEKLDLTFNTQSRKGVGISAGKAFTPYFKIGGTLAEPGLALDMKGAALSGGAAVATAGLSILAEGMWDRWVATAGNPCERLITQTKKSDNPQYKQLLRGLPGTS